MRLKHPDLPILHTARLRLRVVDEQAAPAVLDYYERNRSFHQPWFAARGEDVFTLRQQQANLAAEYAEFKAGRALPFWLSPQEDPARVIGRFAFTNIVRGCFHSCFVAYHLDERWQGAGLAGEAGEAALSALFGDFRMHRAEANIMPANRRSIALASRLGFRLEGISPKYLEINGRWEDHLHFVRLADPEAASEQAPAGPDEPRLETDTLMIKLLRQSDVQPAMQYYERNREQIEAWNPAPPDDLAEAAGWHSLFARRRAEEAAGRALDFGIFFKDRPQWLAGTIEIRQLVPLPQASCEIGFSIDRLLAGRGMMAEALSVIISWLFLSRGLQRINARCAAGHERSLRVLEILGFQSEGVERQAIWLRGTWQDTIRLGLLRNEFRSLGGL